MSILSVRAALQVALNGISSGISTAWENAQFTPPAPGTVWQEVVISMGPPTNREMSGSVFEEVGVMTVALHYPGGKGAKDALTQADTIRDTFRFGSSFTNSGVTVLITGTPTVSRGQTDNSRNEWVVSINVRFRANITV